MQEEAEPTAADLEREAEQERRDHKQPTLKWAAYEADVPVDALDAARNTLWDTKMDQAEQMTQQWRHTNLWAAQL